MAITKIVAIDQTTVEGNGIVLYRQATSIMEDGVLLNKSYHRSSLTPGQDLTGVPASVANICSLVWTPEVVAAYQASLPTTVTP